MEKQVLKNRKKILKNIYIFLGMLAIGSIFCQKLYAAAANDPKLAGIKQIPSPQKIEKPCEDKTFGYVNGAFLYWNALNSGWYTAYKGPANPPDPYIEAEAYRMKFDTDPGCRIEVGAKAKHIDTAFLWTYLRTHPSEFHHGTDTFYGSLFYGGSFYFHRASWKLKYHTIDWELGYRYPFNNIFSIRPYLGLRTAWLKQRFFAYFTDKASRFGSDISEFWAKVNYWGMGLRFGSFAYVNVGYGLALFGNVSASFLYGKTSLYQNNLEIELDDADIKSPLHLVADDIYSIKPTLQLMFGMMYSIAFNEGCNAFHIKAAWEMNYWWDQLPIQWMERCNFVVNKSVQMQGLTLDVQFDF